MYLVEIGESGRLRQATADEVRGILQHLVDYPRCDGTQIRDDADQTMWRLDPLLRCTDCRVKVKVLSA
jgi:hypothetical protein